MRTPTTKVSAESSYQRELKRLLGALTLMSDANSMISLISDYFRYKQFAAGEAGAGGSAMASELMPALWFSAERILLMTEGASTAETLTRSAKLLGTLQLSVPASARRWRDIQFGYKLLYRATLSLRLLDHALQHKLLDDADLQQQFAMRNSADPDCPYRLNVQLPLIIVVMLLDAGQLHSKAAAILSGYAGELDPLRALDSDERGRFLHLAHDARQQLAKDGLGLIPFRADTRQQLQLQQSQQQQRLQFIRLLLQQLDQPAHLLASIVKIPQVYSSMVLPGRHRYVYEALPKVSLLLKERASRGMLNPLLVKHFLQITGIFPQGFGIAYIPTQQDNALSTRYELAVVNQLYPANIAEPLCRVVSRNLQYRRGGHNVRISVDHNLYFKPARERLAVVPKQRLQEILAQLSADWQPGQIRRYIPRCWHPEQFFEQAEHQNLWNNAPQHQN
uniref:Uncharacterized protein n=1 Tax=Rheinheimera sp. BAL341 TaxID=1708203 RepID=A0A486XTA9_9GAMM